MKRTISVMLAAVLLITCAACSGAAEETGPIIAGTNMPDYYSGHTNLQEELYKTTLADPSRLAEGRPVYTANPPPPEYRFNFKGFTEPDPQWGYDVRWRDLSREAIDSEIDTNLLSFNSQTIWPASLPVGFSPADILETGKNPGLGIRALHERGITGDGVGIAIIDQTLLLNHEQYADNLMYYEEIHNGTASASMHGSAVASIAAGRDTGTAPGAKLYYIATTYGHVNFDYSDFSIDVSIVADCILRVLEINSSLPDDEKIRVISISKSFLPEDNGYDALVEAISKADEAGIFVITASPECFYEDLSILGVGRNYISNPDDASAYHPALSEMEVLTDNTEPSAFQGVIRIPQGARAYASCTGTDEYEIGSQGGISWTVPWLSGFYALCCELKPDITPREFIAAVNATGTAGQTIIDGRVVEFGNIINPAAVVELLKGAR